MSTYQIPTQSQSVPNSELKIGQYPKQLEALEQISLRELKLRNAETENAINAVQARISYMRTKQEKTIKKVLNVKRKLSSLQNVKSKAKQHRQIFQEQKKKQEENQVKKTELNKLIKDHLKYNKKIVMTLMDHKVGEESKNFKEKLSQYSMLNQVQRENMREQNTQKANRVRMEHVEAHQKRKMYFLDKLHQFKEYKEHKLREELKERERQQLMISDLEQKEKMLLQRLNISQKFRLKCQQEYQDAKSKYHSFYEASKGLNRGFSRGHSFDGGDNEDERKADIFIS